MSNNTSRDPSTESSRTDSDPLNRRWWRSDPSEAERVSDAVEALATVADVHTAASRRRHDRQTSPDALAAVEAVRAAFPDPSPPSIASRLEDLAESRRGSDPREPILAALEQIDENAATLAQARSTYEHGVGRVRTFPFGRTREESVEAITDAVEAIRTVLVDEESRVDGYGLRAVGEGR
jgi:hypothetical protein